MYQTASQLNPFMLLLNPEIVLAAIEKSERLGQLKRQMCRPLDRVTGSPAESEAESDCGAEAGEDGEDVEAD